VRRRGRRPVGPDSMSPTPSVVRWCNAESKRRFPAVAMRNRFQYRQLTRSFRSLQWSSCILCSRAQPLPRTKLLHYRLCYLKDNANSPLGECPAADRFSVLQFVQSPEFRVSRWFQFRSDVWTDPVPGAATHQHGRCGYWRGCGAEDDSVEGPDPVLNVQHRIRRRTRKVLLEVFHHPHIGVHFPFVNR
jgi:hypothetical protein